MAEANAEGAPKPKKKLLLFIVIGVVTLVVILVVAIAAFLMLRSDHSADDGVVAEAAHETNTKAVKKADSSHPPVFEKLPIFTVNLNSESGEVMQTEIVLELVEATAQAKIKQLLPKVQGGVNKFLSAKTPEEVKTPEGREKLEVEVKDLVNQIIDEESVLSVNFTSFIVR